MGDLLIAEVVANGGVSQDILLKLVLKSYLGEISLVDLFITILHIKLFLANTS